MASSVLPALSEGRLIGGRWRIVRCIQAGGMGSVYEAEHRETQARCALKVMLPELVSSAEMRARFRQEAMVTATIESDHIVKVFDGGTDEETGAPYLVMELLRGEDLAARLRTQGRLSAEEAMILLRQAALALERMHAAGVVHRDLKPGNLFVATRDDGSPCLKVLDFGIAKRVALTSLAETTRAVGTPLYMAPEQVRGDGHIKAPADLYALAQITYTLLAGQAYWSDERAEGKNVYKLLLTITEGAREAASKRAARAGVTLPEAFDAWFARAVALAPDERFGGAREMIDALAHALDGGAPPARAPARFDDATCLIPEGPAAARAELPLSARLPNPPALFVGRTAEIRWLRDAVARAPVTVVAGDGGAGKSALTRFVLHSRFPEQLAATVFVSLSGSDPHEPVALAVARSLVRAAGIRSFDWSEVMAAPQAAGALAIDLADAGERWVVLDDLHHAPADDARAFLGQVSRYARRSKWIATTREKPCEDALAGQVLALGPMKDTELARLARALDPSAPPDTVRRTVARAAGSPWRLRQARSADPSRLAAGLDADTLAFLQALAVLAVPLPEATLAEVAPPPPAGLDALERQGLVERTAQGVRLHEVARDLIPQAGASPRWTAWRAKAGRALAASGDAALGLRGLQLLLEAGCAREAGEALDARGDALLDAGYAAGLWTALEGAPRAATGLETWRLRCAVDLGDSAVLARVQRPERPSDEQRFLWAKILLAKGKPAEAAAEAAEAQRGAASTGDVELAFRAGILSARGRLNGGELREGGALLDALTAPSPLAAAQRDALRAMVLSLVDERELALAALAALLPTIEDLPWPLRGEVGYGAARALYYLGRLRDAGQVLDRALSATLWGSVRFDVGRNIRYAQACIALDAGDLDLARVALDNLEPYVGRGSLLHGYMLSARTLLHLFTGELADMDRAAAELASADLPGHPADEVAGLALRARTLRREPWTDADEAKTGAGSLFSKQNQLYGVELRLRSGRTPPADVAALFETPAQQPELRLRGRLLRALALLLGGAPEGALAEAESALAEARELGYGIVEAEALQRKGDVLIFLGESAALAASAAELGRLASQLPSVRFGHAAALSRALAGEGPPDPAMLEALAAAEMQAPDTAARARRLLGMDTGDALDRTVLDAFATRTGWRAPALVAGGAPDAARRWTPAWGIDEDQARVWLPDGRTVDLSRHLVQMGLLRCLATHGGRAGKAELVMSVWEAREYNPPRHDNRLQAAIHKLRRLIEDDPKAPARVVTEGEGYALRGVVRHVARGPHHPAPCLGREGDAGSPDFDRSAA